MPEIKFFPTTQDLPPLIRQQILDFLRMFYPGGFTGANQFRDWTSTPEDHPRHIVMLESERVISHAEVVWKYLDHNGVHYKAYGLSSVLTYPEFQRQGYGNQVIAAGTEYITKTDADLGLFHCEPELTDFYGRYGWEAMPSAQTLIGDPQHPTVSEELLMMLFLTDKAKSHRTDFETLPFYFGESTW